MFKMAIYFTFNNKNNYITCKECRSMDGYRIFGQMFASQNCSRVWIQQARIICYKALEGNLTSYYRPNSGGIKESQLKLAWSVPGKSITRVH